MYKLTTNTQTEVTESTQNYKTSSQISLPIAHIAHRTCTGNEQTNDQPGFQVDAHRSILIYTLYSTT